MGDRPPIKLYDCENKLLSDIANHPIRMNDRVVEGCVRLFSGYSFNLHFK